MPEPKKIDPKSPYGKITSKQPAVVLKLNSKDAEVYVAKEISPQNLRKSAEFKLALWCPDMKEARRQAKEMNERVAFGRPKVSHDPKNPESGVDYALPSAEGPGAEVKQFIKFKKEEAVPNKPEKMAFKMTSKYVESDKLENILAVLKTKYPDVQVGPKGGPVGQVAAGKLYLGGWAFVGKSARLTFALTSDRVAKDIYKLFAEDETGALSVQQIEEALKAAGFTDIEHSATTPDTGEFFTVMLPNNTLVQFWLEPAGNIRSNVDFYGPEDQVEMASPTKTVEILNDEPHQQLENLIFNLDKMGKVASDELGASLRGAEPSRKAVLEALTLAAENMQEAFSIAEDCLRAGIADQSSFDAIDNLYLELNNTVLPIWTKLGEYGEMTVEQRRGKYGPGAVPGAPGHVDGKIQGAEPKKPKAEPKKKAEKPEAAPAADKDFKEKARVALAKHLEIPIEEMPEPDDKGSHHFVDDDLAKAGKVVSWGALTQDAGGRDYVVYDSPETARAAAIEYVTNDLKESPEMFSQDWLWTQMQDRPVNQHWKDIIKESFENYVNDMSPEELEEELQSAGVGDKAALVDSMVNAEKDPEQYLTDNFGQEFRDEQSKLIMKKLSGAELKEIAEAAVDTDGPGHFLSGWDGKLTDLGNGMQLAMW